MNDVYFVTDPTFEVDMPNPSLVDVWNNVEKDATRESHFFNKDFNIYTNHATGENTNPRFRW